MCCQGECPCIQKSRCRCNCTRCRHCSQCGKQDGLAVGLLVAGAVAADAVTSSRSRVRDHWTRKPWESTETYERVSDDDVPEKAQPETTRDAYGVPENISDVFKRSRQISTSSIGEDVSLTFRSRKSSTMSRSSSTGLARRPSEDCAIM